MSAHALFTRHVMTVVGALNVCTDCMAIWEYGVLADISPEANPWSRLGARQEVRPDYDYDAHRHDGPIGPCQGCGSVAGGDRWRFDLLMPVPVVVITGAA